MQNFGELMPQQARQFCLPEFPIVGYISNRDVDKPTGQLLVRGEQYHTDHSNYEAPPRATALYGVEIPRKGGDTQFVNRSEEHTSELQSLMRISYAVFCLKKQNNHKTQKNARRKPR